MKRRDIQVFMMSHRPVDYIIDNDIITPLQCAAEKTGLNLYPLKDNKGDNISKYNEFYLENTAVYWIWKNVKDAKYKGQTQYRRQLDIHEYLDYDRIFNDFGIIISEPLNLRELGWDSVEHQYADAHNINDIRIMEDIIKEKYPEYAKDYDRYIKNDCLILYSNSFIMKSEDYDKYAEMLFDILREWLNRTNIKTIEDLRNYVIKEYKDGYIPCYTMDPNTSEDWKITYQMRIGGSLAERFLTLYVYHNFKKIYYVAYKKQEGLGAM